MENDINNPSKSTENSNANSESIEINTKSPNESSTDGSAAMRPTATIIGTVSDGSDVPLCSKYDPRIKHNKKKSIYLYPPSNETICDDITATTEDIKRLKHVQVRSNSTGKLYQSSRRVSFPENDSELVTGYLEPADPWACVKPATCVSELAEFYRDSCKRHHVRPIDSIMKHLDTLDLNSNSRRPVLNLREQNLTAESCEALEELLKRVQYKLIDLTDCGLNDASATALFDMIEYYEAANEIDISENRNITNRGWQACINMVKRSHALQILVTRGTPLSESNAISLGKSMLTSSLNTLKLEHCGLSGRPIASLCTYLRKNTVLKELWLAHNDLTTEDAYCIGNVLRSNFYLQFVDLSNNNIQDRGVLHVCEALIEQSNYFKVLHGSTVTAPQPLSSKHTLTRGDKIDLNVKTDKESKYECLARLINSAQVQCDTASVNAPPSDKLADIGKLPDQPPILAAATNKANEDSPANDSNEQQNVTAVTTYGNSANNNQTNGNSTNTMTTDEQRMKVTCELKIVENNERGQQTTPSYLALQEQSNASDNVTNAPEQIDIGIDLDKRTNLDNNNSTGKQSDGGDRLTETRPLLPSEQTAELIAQPHQTNDASQDLIGVTDDNALVKQQDYTNTDCQLDINENKSDMKLNYAEVVKMDSPMEAQLCENRNFAIGNACSGRERNATHIQNCSSPNVSSDLEPKVQITAVVNRDADAAKGSRTIECTSPQPIQKPNSINCGNGSVSGEPDDEMSPICKVRLPLNSPRFTKSKDITSALPLTPDSSHSLDSSCELSTPFETIKPYNTPIVPERSFSSESLNSETSVESNDSKSSIKLAEAKFSKNGTLERQSNADILALQAVTTPNGLQVLMLWNNNITRQCAQTIADLLLATTTLEVLNVGRNVLSNDFIANIKTSLKANTSLTSLGLQSVHLTNEGVKTLSDMLDFGGNTTLQRVDLRDNNLQVTGLTSLNEVLKSNKSITRIDLDDTPRRNHEPNSDSNIDYNRVVNNIRSLCARNENPPEPEPVRTSVKRVRTNFLNSRKISLTCQSIRNSALDTPQIKCDRHLLDPTRKSSRLRSPSPSPIPSPVSSPIPSPSRSRFQVSRVVENSSNTSASSNSCSPTSSSISSSRFRVTVVEPPKVMCAPITIFNNNNNNNSYNTNNNNNNTSHNHKNNLNFNGAAKNPLDKCSAKRVVEPALVQRTHSAPSSTMMVSSARDDVRSDAVQMQPLQSNHKLVKPTDQPIATTLTVIDSTVNSFDSPDLEVKGYMDDSCSSFSSLDSIDRGQSFSSVESFDLIRENKLASDVAARKLSQQSKQTIASINASNSSIDSVESHKFDANVSASLEASTCSNDSIYGSQELPVLKISSNEGTLTNSPVSPCSKEITLSDGDTLSPKLDTDKKQERVRKTSWISRGGDAVPATLDKLLSIFHHPSNLFFTRSNNGDAVRKESPQPSPQSDSKSPSRKESPMGGLFTWTKRDNSLDDKSPTIESTTTNTVKSAKSPLQSNISPETTLNADTIAFDVVPIQLKQDVKENTSPEHTVTADSMANLQTSPTRAREVQQHHQASEQKHQPDHTYDKADEPTAELEMAQPDKVPEQCIEAVAEQLMHPIESHDTLVRVEKVHFEVGGDDDDDDDYDNVKSEKIPSTLPMATPSGTKTRPTLTLTSTPSPSLGSTSPASINSANLLPKKALGLGQIARDSLSILKGQNNSQDSMRSLESLSELAFEEEHCINRQQPIVHEAEK